MTYVTRRLTDKNRDQLRNPTLGNGVRATFTCICYTDMLAIDMINFIRKEVRSLATSAVEICLSNYSGQRGMHGRSTSAISCLQLILYHFTPIDSHTFTY